MPLQGAAESILVGSRNGVTNSVSPEPAIGAAEPSRAAKRKTRLQQLLTGGFREGFGAAYGLFGTSTGTNVNGGGCGNVGEGPSPGDCGADSAGPSAGMSLASIIVLPSSIVLPSDD